MWKPPLPEQAGREAAAARQPPKPAGRRPRGPDPLSPGPARPPRPRTYQLQDFKRQPTRRKPAQGEVGGEAAPGAPDWPRVLLRSGAIHRSILHRPGTRWPKRWRRGLHRLQKDHQQSRHFLGLRPRFRPTPPRLRSSSAPRPSALSPQPHSRSGEKISRREQHVLRTEEGRRGEEVGDVGKDHKT